MIGTHPEGAKISQNRLKNKDMVKDTSAFINPNNNSNNDVPDYGIVDPVVKIMEPKQYRKLQETNPKKLTAITFNYFMENYGKYSSDPKKLFCDAYGGRINQPEHVFSTFMNE